MSEKFSTKLFVVGALLMQSAVLGAEADDSNFIGLTPNAVENLGIETVEAQPREFEKTVFAIGRIEEVPDRHAVVSSRIPGRIVEVNALPGDMVREGDVLIKVESRQFGDPPPVIEVKSPISGMMTEAHVRLGESVDPEREMMDVVDLGEMWAVARVPEDSAANLRPGAKARIRVAALGDKVFDGELLRFGTTADASGGTIDAIFLVPNPENRMRAGMRAEFSIVEGRRENVTAIPKEAVQGTATDPVVFIKDYEIPNGFRRLPVRIGEKNDRYVEVLSGLFVGDEVVVKGAYPLSFVSGGGISLKEALDAAHGHEHAEDGSELTEEQKAAKSGGEGAASEAAPVNRFLAIACGVLVVMLILSVVMKKK